MGKYIRTKYGIYDTDTMSVSQLYDGDIFLENVSYCKQINDTTFIYIDEKDILKKADTIEELCDEFICLENKMIFHDLETITSSCNLKHLTVHGAIWTDKGLIYVAKMNKNGELELL